jgi:hypothetical protein
MDNFDKLCLRLSDSWYILETYTKQKILSIRYKVRPLTARLYMNIYRKEDKWNG